MKHPIHAARELSDACGLAATHPARAVIENLTMEIARTRDALDAADGEDMSRAAARTAEERDFWIGLSSKLAKALATLNRGASTA